MVQTVEVDIALKATYYYLYEVEIYKLHAMNFCCE